MSGAEARAQVDLFQLESLDAVVAAIRAHARSDPDAAWVRGRGWMYMAFPGGLPPSGLLDEAVPDRPAFMSCYDGHTAWVNRAALRAAGIDRDTPDPPAGEIVRDPVTGEPTGILKEAAQDLFDGVLPRMSPDELLAATRRTITDLHAAGITSVQDAGTEPEEVALWRTLLDDGSLRLRSRLSLPMRPDGSLDAWRSTLDGYEALVGDLRGGAWLDAGILKAFADGVVEARTAAMLAPYVDDTSTGRPEWESGQLDAFVAEADARGWQVQIHAIGDAGVRMALDAYERAAAAGEPREAGRRHRVEHVETIDRADIDGSAGSASSRRCSRITLTRHRTRSTCGPGTSARTGPAGRGRGPRSGGPAA